MEIFIYRLKREKNVIIFDTDIRSSVPIDDKNKNILIISEEPTQELDDTTLTAEAKYPNNFTKSGKRFVLSLYYNGSNSFYWLMLQNYINAKQKNLK